MGVFSGIDGINMDKPSTTGAGFLHPEYVGEISNESSDASPTIRASTEPCH
jgi:hypothetical protein